MGPSKRKRLHKNVAWPEWGICAIFLFLNLISISSSFNIRKNFKRNADLIPLVNSVPSNETSSEFTIITPSTGYGNLDEGVGKHRRVVRRRRKKVPINKSVITSVPFPDSNVHQHESVPVYEAVPRRRPQNGKRGHSNKVSEVWKVQNFNLDQVMTSDLKPSALDKRESSEKTSHRENSHDLHPDESYNPFLNSSTPISTELQNSLQFTLQILHPLLNSDVDLSQKQKVPENKTVAVTHSLSESVAQTPIVPDIGFLPTHLKKKHPLLNQDSFFSGDDGASKTGVRTNNDIQPIQTTTYSPSTPALDTSIFSTMPTTSSQPTIITTSSSTTSKPISSTSSITTTEGPTSTTSRATTSKIPSTTTSRLPSTLRTTTTTTTFRTPITTSTIPSTTSKPPSTTTLATKGTTKISTTTRGTTPTTTSTYKPSTKSTTTKMTTKTPIESIPSLDHILGILNITELKLGNFSAAEASIIPIEGTESLEKPHKVTTTKTLTNSKTSVFPPQTNSKLLPTQNSGEVSSVEQFLVEQLLGIGSQNHETIPGATKNGNVNPDPEILNLFNTLLQGQLQNQGKQNGQQNSNEQANVLLQNLILSSLKTQNQNQNQPDLSSILNLEKLLASTTTNKPSLTTGKPTPTTTPFQLPKNFQTESGLSDADIKSIFELLNAKPSAIVPQSSTTAKPTTTSTTTTTSRPTTRLTTIPPTTSTTLHPALQSMLDMFKNQLKPFQSIPSSASTFLAKPSVTPTRLPSTTTQAPTTINSLDFLSQLLNFGGGGDTKVNPVRATPQPEFSLASIFGNQLQPPPNPVEGLKTAQSQEFSLASIFGKNSNLFPTNLPSPTRPPFPLPNHETSAPSESNQLLNFFGSYTTTPPPPSGLYYWLDLNAFLGGDPKADGMTGIRPKIGNKFPFIKINR